MTADSSDRGTGPVRKLRRALAPFAKTALLRTGAYSALRRAAPSSRVAILRYHAICDEEGYRYADPTICISPAAFDQHVRYLASNYRVLALDEVVRRLTEGKDLPPNTVVITFDDGYADNLPAARTLHRYGAPATFFITAGCIGGEHPFWLAELRQLVSALAGGSLDLALMGTSLTLTVDDPASRARAIRQVTRAIKSHPISIRESLLDQLRAAVGEPSTRDYMLDWPGVREMQRLGMSIGAHTLTHPNLPSAGDIAARAEIVGAKSRLEDELGSAITLFSYPNGGAERYYTPSLQSIVRESGFLAACTSRNGFAARSSDPFALERIEVEERLEDLVFALEVERFAFAPEN